MFLLLVSESALGQNHTDIIDQSNTKDFETLVEQIETHYASFGTGKNSGYKQYKRWENFNASRLSQNDEILNISAKNFDEWQKWKGGVINGLSQGQWIENPYSTTAPTNRANRGTGRVGAIAMDPDGNLFIGSAGGGIWKRKVNTTFWEPLSDGLPSIGVASIALDPNLNAQGFYNIYILTGDGNIGNLSSSGIFRSSDGGQTWNSTALSFPWSDQVRGMKLLMDPQNSLNQFAATTGGIYKTTNGWVSSQHIQTGHFTDLEFAPYNSNVIYAAEIPSISSSTTIGRLWKSSNYGVSFTIVSTPTLLLSEYRLEIAITPAAPDNVYVLQGGGSLFNLFLSTDNATSFNLKSQIPLGYQSTQDLEVAVSPTDPSDVYVGSFEVWHSENVGSGSNFTRIQNVSSNSLSWMHVDIAALEILDGRIFCGHDGGIHELTNLNPVTWTNLSDGLRILQIYDLAVDVQDPNRYAMGTQDNGSNLLDATGVLVQFGGGDGDRVVIDRLNPEKISYRSWWGGVSAFWQKDVVNGSNDQFNYIFSSTSSGFVANSLKGAPHKSPLIFSPSDNTIVYGNTKFGDIIRADFSPLFYPDPSGQPNLFGASSYTNLTSGQIIQPLFGGADLSPCTHIAVAKSNSNYVYAVKSNRALWVTKNGGVTWTQIYQAFKKSHYISDIVICPTNPEKLWISFGGYDASLKVRYSIDAGNNWLDLSTGLPNLSANCLVYQEGSDDQLYVGMDVGVYVINNSSTGIWSPFLNGLPNTIVKDLEINYNDYSINAGTYGRGMWRSHLACTDQLTFPVGHVHSLPENHEAQTIESQASNNTGSDVTYRGAQDVVLKENFVANASLGEFKAFIEPCGDPSFKRGRVKTITGTYAGPLEGIDASSLDEPKLDQPKSMEVVVFPNPANTELQIGINALHEGKASLTIFDLVGHVVLNGQEQSIYHGSQIIRMDVSQLTNGIYTLVIETNGITEKQQVVISH